MSSSSGEKDITLACLGRPFSLGMLYDCRSDQLIPAMTLWESDVLKSSTSSFEHIGSNFEIIAEDSLEVKALKVQIGTGLKLSFMASLVEASGSAKYLYDHKLSKQQSRVSLKYWSTSQFDQLTMNQLGHVQHPEIFTKNIATHVVTGVQYGTDAFFVFDKVVQESERVQSVNTEVLALVKKMCTVGGDGAVEINVKDQAEISKIQCTFYSDILLPKNPTNFEEALRVFKDLPDWFRGKVGVPKKVWLLPLSAIDNGAPKILHKISVNVVTQAEKVLEDLLECERESNDIIKIKGCSYFLAIQRQLIQFKGMTTKYKMTLFEAMGRLIPAVREGRRVESELMELLQQNENSPFCSHRLNIWLNDKKKEVRILCKHSENLRKRKSIHFVQESSELDGIVTDLNYDCIVCLSFNFLSTRDATLELMKKYMDTKTTVNIADEPAPLWITNVEFKAKLREKVKQYLSFVGANDRKSIMKTKFVVNFGERGSKDDVSIRCIQDGIPSEFDPPSNPQDLREVSVSQNSVTIQWSEPVSGSASVQYYHIWYRRTHRDGKIGEWKYYIKTKRHERTITVAKLKPASSYSFAVCAECSIGVSEFSEQTNPICTLRHEKYSEIFKDEGNQVPQDGAPPTYKIFGQELDLPGRMLKKVVIGEPTRGVPERVLLLVGATGAGKSTLINGMMNYIFGVKWKDNFRFKLIVEAIRSQVHSQTRQITAYVINHMYDSPIDYNITIIDTPGFGDTQGLERDRQITEQIKEFFSIPTQNGGISHLDGIGFVTQSALARLTPTQKYIFDSILSIFGKDVAKNIFIMVTFCDGQKPPVMSAIEEAQVPHSGFFKFNNSALYAEGNEGDEDNFDEMFWKMGVNSFRKFFVAFQKAQSVSLSMTKDVLEQRDRLEAIFVGLQTQMQICLAEMEVLSQERDILKSHEMDIESNINFTCEMEVPHVEKQDLPQGVYVTNCIRCNFTCHCPCTIMRDSLKRFCSAMDWSGKCRVCPNKCQWKDHRHTGERFVISYKTETKTLDDLKRKYESAAKGKAAVEEMLTNHQNRLEQAHEDLCNMIDQAQECLLKLDEIALKPNPLTQIEYIELLISSEQQQGKQGYEKRIGYLEKAKQQVELLSIMRNVQDIDKQIMEEREREEIGWRKRVEILKCVKKIKREVEVAKGARKQPAAGTISHAINTLLFRKDREIPARPTIV